jgi:hypothetical protein
MLRWLSVALLLCLGAWATADETGALGPDGNRGIPFDWSHHHLIYSSPPTMDGLREIQKEPRFWQQFYRTVLAGHQPLLPPRRPEPDAAEGLWGKSLPSTSATGTVGAGHYPAKYSFNGAVNCSDFVVFNSSLGGGAGSTTIVFKAASAPSGTVVITNSSTGAVLTLTAGTSTSGTTWANNSATAATDAAAFNTALNTAGNGSSVGVYSTVSSGTVTLTASQLGAVTISVRNNSVSNITTPASGVSENFASGVNAARLTAYKNLYSGTCSGVPTLSWECETGGTVKTSVALSSNGTQLAFVQSYNTASATTNAELVLLKPGTSATLSYPTIVSASAYRTCTAPCLAVFPLKSDDTNSSPFIDYADDVAYVGDSAGNLYKFTGVFNGTPAEVVTSPWPVSVSTKALTSPVYDTATLRIFLGDAGGFLYSYTASTGVLFGKSSQLIATGSAGIVDAPIVDSVQKFAYVFVGDDGNTATGFDCKNATGCTGIFRFATSFSGNGTGTCASSNGTSWTAGTSCGSESILGVGKSTTILYDGTFDNAYYASAGGNAGNIWTCPANGSTPTPALFHTSMSTFSTATVSVATAAVSPLTSATASCSPVTEILNGATDWIFLSVTASGNQTVCKGTTTAGACVYSFSVGGAVPTAASAGRLASGGTSGIIIDNTGAGGGSQIYFTYLAAATSSIACPSPASATAGG